MGEKYNSSGTHLDELFKDDPDAKRRGIIEALRHSVWASDMDALRTVLINELQKLGGENWAAVTLNNMPRIEPSSARPGHQTGVDREGVTLFKEDQKFFSLQDLFVCPPVLDVPWEKKYNICVVYACWWNHFYLKPLYLSLMSQFAYTDIHNVDVKILTGGGFIHDVANQLFHMYNPPAPQERLVWPLPDGAFYKYMVTTHPILSEYDVIVVIDSDAFAYAPAGPHDFYKNLWATYKKGKLNLTMCSENRKAEFSLFERHARLANRIPRDHYKEYLCREASLMPSKLDNFLSEDDWLLSCITIIPKHCFREPSFGTYGVHQLYNDIRCDETVWLMWALANNYSIDLLDDMNGVRWGPADSAAQLIVDIKKKTVAQDFKLGWVHPIAGFYMADPVGTRWLPPFYAEIEKAAMDRYGREQ